MKRLKILWDIFYAAAAIGAVALGGGYIIMALARSSLVQKRRWITEDELMTYLAMSQTLPGIIALNLMSFIGYKRAGWLGALAGVLGMVFVPVVCVTVLATFVRQVDDYPCVAHFLTGAQIAVCVLIGLSGFDFYKQFVKKNAVAHVLFGGALAGYLFWGVSPVVPIVAAAAFGALWFYKTKRVFKS